jgi:DNA-binding IclR family transcriptional regulator
LHDDLHLTVFFAPLGAGTLIGMDTQPHAPRPRATAAGKVLSVLETFAPGAPRLSLSAIAQRSGLTMATTHRVVGELRAWGALERGEDGRYGIGLRLWELASLSVRGPGLRDAALPFLEDLYEATRENAQLAVRDGTELVFIERLASRDAVRVHTRVGMRFPLPPSGAGLALLAFAPREILDEVLSSPLRRFTEKTITDPKILRATLAQTRREGAALSIGQVTLDSLSVGAPVFAGSNVVGALSVVVHADAHAQALVPLVRSAARALSRTLSGTQAGRRPLDEIAAKLDVAMRSSAPYPPVT